MGLREEVENEIWAYNIMLDNMIKLKPSHPDYAELTKARQIISDRIKKLQEELIK